MIDLNKQEKLFSEAESAKDAIISCLKDAYDIIEDNIKNEEQENKINEYHIKSIILVWKIFYVNCCWLAVSFCDMNVPFWQIAMTERLLFECVADLNELLKVNGVDKFEKVFKQLSKEQSIEDYMEGMKKTNFNNKFKYSNNGNMKRVKNFFHESGVQHYNILSQFNHVNSIGADLALRNSLDFLELRKSIINVVPSLIEGLFKIISESGYCDELHTISMNSLDKIKLECKKYLEKKVND